MDLDASCRCSYHFRSQAHWTQEKLRTIAKHARSQRRVQAQRADAAEARIAELETAGSRLSPRDASSTANELTEIAAKARSLVHALHTSRDRGTALHDAIAGLDDIERLARSVPRQPAEQAALWRDSAGDAMPGRQLRAPIITGAASDATGTITTALIASKRPRNIIHNTTASEARGSSVQVAGRSPACRSLSLRASSERHIDRTQAPWHPVGVRSPPASSSRQQHAQVMPPQRELKVPRDSSLPSWLLTSYSRSLSLPEPN